MIHYLVEPEVAGGLGDETLINRSTHPPRVERLHYEFDGWLGDVLLESFPCFIVTDEARQKLQAMEISGARFDEVTITTSDQFEETCPGKRLPKFSRLVVEGTAGLQDVGTTQDGRLVVSERVLEALKKLGISNAIVEEFGK